MRGNRHIPLPVSTLVEDACLYHEVEIFCTGLEDLILCTILQLQNRAVYLLYYPAQSLLSVRKIVPAKTVAANNTGHKIPVQSILFSKIT